VAIGADRVQVLKRESAALGGDSADEADYPSPIEPQEDAIECAGLYLQDGAARDEAVYIERNAGAMRFRDTANTTPVTLSDLLGTAAVHETIDSLVHEIAETSFVQVVRTSGRVTSIVVWETAGMLKKIRETLITRASGQVSVIVEKQYDGAGALLAGQTLTHTVSRSGGQVDSIASVET